MAFELRPAATTLVAGRTDQHGFNKKRADQVARPLWNLKSAAGIRATDWSLGRISLPARDIVLV